MTKGEAYKRQQALDAAVRDVCRWWMASGKADNTFIYSASFANEVRAEFKRIMAGESVPPAD